MGDGWEFWTTFEDVPLILDSFRSGKPKESYCSRSNLNFRNFFVNGKQPKWTNEEILSDCCFSFHSLKLFHHRNSH